MFLAFAEGAPTVQLLPDGTMLFHVVLVLVMIYVLNRTFFRPINRIIESRVKRRGGGFTEAEEILNKVGAKKSRYQQAVLEARSEGYELIEKERAEAIKKREAELNQVSEEVTTTLSREKEELKRQSAEARAAIEQEADKLADKITSNILKAA